MFLREVWCLLLLAILAFASITGAAPQRRYSSKYDFLNVDSIINNNRVLTKYIQCLMGEGVCTPEGRDLKEALPKVLEIGCEKCTEKEKNMVKRAAKHVKENRPDDWKRILEKFDPEEKYREKIDSFVSD